MILTECAGNNVPQDFVVLSCVQRQQCWAPEMHSSLSGKNYGLKLHIPKGCLPVDVDLCKIRIQASLAGQYEFPENSHIFEWKINLCL